MSFSEEEEEKLERWRWREALKKKFLRARLVFLLEFRRTLDHENMFAIEEIRQDCLRREYHR
jgi:hypothetical protein